MTKESQFWLCSFHIEVPNMFVNDLPQIKKWHVLIIEKDDNHYYLFLLLFWFFWMIILGFCLFLYHLNTLCSIVIFCFTLKRYLVITWCFNCLYFIHTLKLFSFLVLFYCCLYSVPPPKNKIKIKDYSVLLVRWVVLFITYWAWLKIGGILYKYTYAPNLKLPACQWSKPIFIVMGPPISNRLL